MPVPSPLIIVPTYNEVENVWPLLDGISKATPHVHVLFVDDGSRDGTVEAIQEFQKKRPGAVDLLSRDRKLGLAQAYLDGFQWGIERSYDPLIQMDGDLSHDSTYLPTMLKLLETHPGVIGSRYVKGGGTVNWGLFRRLMSRSGGIYSRMLLGIDIADPTGGFNGWRAHALKTIQYQQAKSQGYAFQVELKYRATLHGFKLVEFPITFVDRRAGMSKMSTRILFEAVYRVASFRRLKHSIRESSPMDNDRANGEVQPREKRG